MSNTRSLILPPVIYFLSLSYYGAMAQAPAPSPALDCTTALLNLSACLTYVEEGSNLTRPEKGCCRSLAGLLDAQPVCLCQLMSGSDSFGVRVDTVKALMLPTACRVNTPPLTQCSVVGIPVGSPVAPEPAATNGDPEIPGSTAGSNQPAGSAGKPAGSPQRCNKGPTPSRATALGFFISLLTAGTIVICMS